MNVDKKPTKIGALEEMLLLAVVKLGHEAYGAQIQDVVTKAGHAVGTGVLYVTLNRMAEKRLLTIRPAEEKSPRGGRDRIYYVLGEEAYTALRMAELKRFNLKGGKELQAFLDEVEL